MVGGREPREDGNAEIFIGRAGESMDMREGRGAHGGPMTEVARAVESHFDIGGGEHATDDKSADGLEDIGELEL